jgi:hypothetical protein
MVRWHGSILDQVEQPPTFPVGLTSYGLLGQAAARWDPRGKPMETEV